MNKLRAQSNVGSEHLSHVHHERRVREDKPEMLPEHTDTNLLQRLKGRLALHRSAKLEANED